MKSSEESLARPSSKAFFTARNERRLFRLVTGGILIALALAVILLRLQRLDELPPGLESDEATHGLNALQVLRGEHAVFFPVRAHGTESLMAYMAALPVSLLGRTELALRLPAALAGAGTLFVVFWLGQVLFRHDGESGQATSWRGLLIGGAAAGLMAVAIGQTVIGRTAARANFLPLLLSLCVAFLWEAWPRNRVIPGRWRAAAAGVCAGLLPYTYPSAYVTPLLFLLFALSCLLPFRSGTKKQLLKQFPQAALFLGVAGLVAAPILLFAALHPDVFFLRGGQVWVFLPEASQGNPAGTFLKNVWDHLLVFGFRGDPYWRYNFPFWPMLNSWQAIFFWFGVGMAVRQWQKMHAYRLLLLWLGVMILPAILTRDSISPSSVRMNGATPAIFLLVGVGIWETFQLLRNRFFPRNVSRVALVAGSLVGVAIFIQGVVTFHTYFNKWPAATGRGGHYETVWEDLIRNLNSQPASTDTVYLIPTTFRHESLEYLYQADAPAHLIYTNGPDLPRSIESTLVSGKEIATVKAVDWDDDLVGGIYNIDERLFTLLGKYGRYVESEKYDNFRIHSFADIEQDRSWTLFQQLGPPEVHYDGGITLNGVALGHSDEQEAVRQTIDLGESRTLWMVLQWQVAPGLQVDYSASIRLHDVEGSGVFQNDVLLHNWNYETTRYWTAREPVDTLSFLVFPADLPPGEYELRLVVYDFETLKPTVELGVWEAEKVLARLRLQEGE